MTAGEKRELVRFNLGLAAVCAVIYVIVRENTPALISQLVGLYLCTLLIILNRQQKKLEKDKEQKK